MFNRAQVWNFPFSFSRSILLKSVAHWLFNTSPGNSYDIVTTAEVQEADSNAAVGDGMNDVQMGEEAPSGAGLDMSFVKHIQR